MPILSYPVEVEGRVVGHAMTLGERVSFHTSQVSLGRLDGRRFGSLDELDHAVDQQMRDQSGR